MRQWTLGSWAYEWNANGSLHKIKRADGKVFTFKYDAFGRRISKSYHRREFLYIWDGNVLLHEIKKDYQLEDQLTTWIFQDFVPVAKLQGDKSYSIISDHIGTPLVAIDNEGVKVWERELDIYGKIRKETKETPNFVPFRYQGEYYDSEVDLCYNRFRYYDPNRGNYISQDPISILGGLNVYAYVHDPNTWIDIFGWYGDIFLGETFRGIVSKQPLFYPTQRDISFFANKNKMPGISTFNNINEIQNINSKFSLGMEKVIVIDTTKLTDNLTASLDSDKGHVSIHPSDKYLKKNNLTMLEALEDWVKEGDKHILSQNIEEAVTDTKCL